MLKTKKAAVPRLRFPEFRDTGPWEVKRLGEIFRERNERGGENLELLSITKTIGVVCASELNRKSVASSDLSNYKRVYPGDIVNNSMNILEGAIGLSRLHGLVSPAYTVLVATEKQNPIFWSYYFKSPQSITKFECFFEGTFPKLKYSAFSVIKIAAPAELKEQQKIADCLSSLDELIELETKRLEALKAHKKGLLQQLFPREGETTPRLRFPEFRDTGPWEVKRLGEIFRERNERGGENLELLSITKTKGVVRASELNRKSVASSDLSNYKRVYPGDIVKPLDVRGGAIGLSRLHGLISPAYTVVVAIEKQNPIFWSYYFKSPRSITEFDRLSEGPFRRLKYPAFFATKVAFPAELKEQQKIADCLSSLDELIELETKRLEALKAHKKGLLQQLFPQEVV